MSLFVNNILIASSKLGDGDVPVPVPVGDVYTTTFSEYEGDLNSAPSDWTKWWAGSNGDYDIRRGNGIGCVMLEVDTNNDRAAYTWDEVGNIDTNVDILARVLTSYETSSGVVYLTARVSGSGGSENGYLFKYLGEDTGVGFSSIKNGSVISVGSDVSIPSLPDDMSYMYLRFQVTNNLETGNVDLKGKFWKFSESEPENWTIEASDTSSTLSSGAVGIYQYKYDCFYDFISIATEERTPEHQTFFYDFSEPDYNANGRYYWHEKWNGLNGSVDIGNGTGIGLKQMDLSITSESFYLYNCHLLKSGADASYDLYQSEILTKLKSLNSDDDKGAFVWCRASGETDSENGYCTELDISNNQVKLGKMDGGSYTILDTVAKTLSNTKWYWVRFQANGTTIKTKVWEDGTAEPGSWDSEVTDATHASGWVGIGAYRSEGVSCDYIAVEPDTQYWPIDEPT